MKMHRDMFLLAERLVVAIEGMSEDIKNLSMYVYNLSCSVSSIVNENREKEGTSPVACDEVINFPCDTPVADYEDSAKSECFLLYEQADESSVSYINDLAHEEIFVQDVESMRIDNRENRDIISSFTEGIKLEVQSEGEENGESCGVRNTSESGRSNVERLSKETSQQPHFAEHETVALQDFQSGKSFAVASCSTGESTLDEETTADKCMLKQQEHKQVECLRYEKNKSDSNSKMGLPCEETQLKSETQDLSPFVNPSEGSERGGRRAFKCTICERQFPQKSRLVEHVRVHTGERPFKCKFCESAFFSKSSLRRHIRAHTDERPFKCDQCGKAFHQSSAFRKHVNIHLSVKPFICHQCGKQFNSNNQLKGHIFKHTGEKPYLCSQCGKAFHQRDNLSKHMYFHRMERRFKCSYCEKSFHRSCDLSRHILFHTHDGRFRCSQCPKSFHWRGSLTRHMLVHNREKHFRCSYCEKSFQRRNSLTLHERVHAVQEPFRCGQCGEEFNSTEHLSVHQLTHTK